MSDITKLSTAELCERLTTVSYRILDAERPGGPEIREAARRLREFADKESNIRSFLTDEGFEAGPEPVAAIMNVFASLQDDLDALRWREAGEVPEAAGDYLCVMLNLRGEYTYLNRYYDEDGWEINRFDFLGWMPIPEFTRTRARGERMTCPTLIAALALIS